MDKKLIAAALLLGACVEHKGSTLGGSVAILNVNLKTPDPGSPSNPATSLDTVIDVASFLEDGTPFPGTTEADVFLSEGGVLTGLPTNCGDVGRTPLAHFSFAGGSITDQKITLPSAYGTSAIWVDETNSHVVGSTVPMFYPNPTIPDIMTPPDPTAVNATFCTPFDRRFITVDHATGSGELLVDSLFQGALTVVDTGAVETGYAAMYIYTFGAPAADIQRGSKIAAFSGNVSKFVGFTEVNFPVITADDTASVEEGKLKLPAPVVVNQTDTGNTQKLNALVGRSVVTTGIICPNGGSPDQQTHDQWVKYNTFVLGTGQVCNSLTDFSIELPTKVVTVPKLDGTTTTFDPTTDLVGTTLTVQGMLKNSSGQTQEKNSDQSPLVCETAADCQKPTTDTCRNNLCYKGAYNFWTIVLRDGSDLVSRID